MIVFQRSAFEVRCPFFDYALTDFLYSLPEPLRSSAALHREVITQRMPSLALVPYDKDDSLPHTNPLIGVGNAALQKAKRGVNKFIAPVFPKQPRLYADYENYLRTDLRAWAENILFDARTTSRGLFDQGAGANDPSLRGQGFFLDFADAGLGLLFAFQLDRGLGELQRERLEFATVAMVPGAAGVRRALQGVPSSIEQGPEQRAIRGLAAQLAHDALGLSPNTFLGFCEWRRETEREQRRAERDAALPAERRPNVGRVWVRWGGRLRAPRGFHAETKPRTARRVKALVPPPEPRYRRGEARIGRKWLSATERVGTSTSWPSLARSRPAPRVTASTWARSSCARKSS